MNNNVEKLLNEIGKLVVAQNERTKERYSHGELFNVFNILGLESKEVRLHSALLAELLRPNGMSGVGNAFQKAFLAILGLPENYIVDGKMFVLPNNGNIIMAAQQCGALTEKNVVVIPTKTVPQGITAMMNVPRNGCSAYDK